MVACESICSHGGVFRTSVSTFSREQTIFAWLKQSVSQFKLEHFVLHIEYKHACIDQL